MKFKFSINQKMLPIVLLVVSTCWILFTCLISACTNKDASGNDITNLSARSEHREIYLSWRLPAAARKQNIELTISSGDTKEIVILDPSTVSYHYTEGSHGSYYSFAVKLTDSDGYLGEGQVCSALFLDMDKLPALPVVSIETVSGQLPPFSYISAPSGYLGKTIADNEYVASQYSIAENGRVIMCGTAQMRVRGNTSAYMQKLPFKIKLDERQDLLNRGNDIYNDTEWLLIPSFRALNVEAGFETSKLCGQEWQPSYRPVNLIVNGDWLGCYYLLESVKVSPGRINLSDTGFILENNTYWWSEPDNSFHTPLQPDAVGYTFKDPNASAFSEEERTRIYSYMDAFEQAVLKGNGDYLDYMDMDSFANWLLIHDILGTWDSGGSNMFILKKDMNEADPYSSKLVMGPVWDFDSCFQTTDTWSRVHDSAFMFYSTFTRKATFNKAYIQRWKAVSKSLPADMEAFLKDYLNTYGEALQESWDLDAARWGNSAASVKDVMADTAEWFETRSAWLEEAISGL